LLNGGQLFLTDKGTLLTAENLKKTISKYEIGTMWLSSPLFNQLVEADVEVFSGLRNFLVGGDVLSPVHINKLRGRFPRLNVINGYGPTENTTFSTTCLIDKEYWKSIPIGSPIANSTAYVLDGRHHLQPVEVPGELCVGGDGLSRGYFNDPELTARKFVSNPSVKGEKIYKTGDLVRWLPDGKIEFLGRIDRQVKIRGYRIELGEIESRLLLHDAIKETVVLSGEDDGRKHLQAYIVSDKRFDILELRGYLSEKLPDYMVPSHFIRIDRMPLTSSGKDDRKTLESNGVTIAAGTAYVRPHNEIEKNIAHAWQEVLNRDNISIHDNFFDIGGTSIDMMVLSGKLRERVRIENILMKMFQYPTIHSFVEYINEAASGSDRDSRVKEQRAIPMAKIDKSRRNQKRLRKLRK
jgi:acyl-coenzyme A synthetase/AMP-(fatty) acid ligase/acyl carrier protein